MFINSLGITTSRFVAVAWAAWQHCANALTRTTCAASMTTTDELLLFETFFVGQFDCHGVCKSNNGRCYLQSLPHEYRERGLCSIVRRHSILEDLYVYTR